MRAASPLRDRLSGEVNILPWLVRRRVEILLALGVLFRLVQYLNNRGLWMDEASLAGNIHGKPLGALFRQLQGAQLAPAAFLVVEWATVRVLGTSTLTLRLFPFVCGIAALFLFARVASRALRPEAALIALGLFVLADDLIYYASELKQYSTDLAVTLACDLLALQIASGEATRARLAGFAALGAAGVWFSHPSAFVLAGLGTVLIISALWRRDWKQALALSLVSVVWLASFAGVYAVSLRQVGPGPALWVFWDFAFPRVPPISAREAAWPIQWVVFLCANPVNFDTPIGARGSCLFAFGLFLVGCFSLWNQRRRQLLALFTAPILVTLAIAYLHLYPPHGRLVLFLVPPLLLLIAEGTARVLDAFGNRPLVRGAFLVFLFVLPTLYALENLTNPGVDLQRTPHGDRRPMKVEPGVFPF